MAKKQKMTSVMRSANRDRKRGEVENEMNPGIAKKTDAREWSGGSNEQQTNLPGNIAKSGRGCSNRTTWKLLFVKQCHMFVCKMNTHTTMRVSIRICKIDRPQGLWYAINDSEEGGSEATTEARRDLLFVCKRHSHEESQCWFKYPQLRPKQHDAKQSAANGDVNQP